MGTFSKDRAASYAGLGLRKVIPFVPTHGGTLQVANLFGSDWDGAAQAGDDYSGHGRNSVLGTATVNATSVSGGSSPNFAKSGITQEQLFAGGAAATLCVVADVPTTAPPTPVAQSSEGSTDFIALHVVPSSNWVRAYTNVGGVVGSAIHVFSTVAVEGRPTMYFATWDGTAVKVGLVLPNGALESTLATLAVSPSGNGVFYHAKTAAPHSLLHSFVGHSAVLTDAQIIETHAAMQAKLAEQGVAV